MWRLIRLLLTVTLVALVIVGVTSYIRQGERKEAWDLYNTRVAIGKETAIWGALFDATRTAETDQVHYRLIKVADGQPLAEVAVQYNTTVEAIRMANRLLPSVEFGSGVAIIVPQDVQRFDPPRYLEPYQANAQDTWESIARRANIRVEQLQADNPILTVRGIIPGDLVFIPHFL
jgi:hypothetical protein